MAENIKTIQLRLNTVNQVSKITNAMNLVAMSKLQKFQRQMNELKEISQQFDEIGTETFETSKDLPVVPVVISADLGLAALYYRTLQTEVQKLGAENVFWIGRQGYDRLQRIEGIEILNEMRSSDQLYMEDFFDEIIHLMDYYQIQIAIPRMSGNEVEVEWRELNRQLIHTDLIIYEPDYETANKRYQEFYMYVSLYEAYYQSKFSENMVRRIAMQAATDNANDMREQLRNRFNQLRQEEITQEILELSAGVE